MVWAYSPIYHIDVTLACDDDHQIQAHKYGVGCQWFGHHSNTPLLLVKKSVFTTHSELCFRVRHSADHVLFRLQNGD